MWEKEFMVGLSNHLCPYLQYMYALWGNTQVIVTLDVERKEVQVKISHSNSLSKEHDLIFINAQLCILPKS